MYLVWIGQTRCDVNRKTGLPLLFAAAMATAVLALEAAAKPTNQGNSQGNGSQANSGNGQGNNGNGQGNGGQGNNGNGQGGGGQGNGGSGAGSPAPAPAPAYCSGYSPGLHPWKLAAGNVTIAATAADDCWGVVTKDNWSTQADPFGNDSAGTINLNALFWFADWGFVVRDPSDSGSPSSGSFGGVTWTLTGNGDGTWSLETRDPPPAQITVDFIAVLKGADSWAGWFFDDFTFSVPSTTDDGSWTIAWNSNGGQTAGFSHMSLYMRDARVPPPPTNPACTGQACSSNVPEPGTLALIAFGAWGIGAVRRRGKLLEPKRVGA